MRQIDVLHRGREKVIACFEMDGILIDPGPQSCEETLLAGLGGERPKALLLTHIHFDHAGAAGSLVRRWPDLDVYVHERGAPHMARPERLVASAARLYGGEEGLRETWGEVVPVPVVEAAPTLDPMPMVVDAPVVAPRRKSSAALRFGVRLGVSIRPSTGMTTRKNA